MKVNFIVFNSGEKLLKDIITYINGTVGCSVTDLTAIYLEDKYGSFIEDVYKMGPIPQEDLKMKQNFVQSNGRTQKIYILTIEFETMHLTYHDAKSKFVYVEEEALKSQLRNSFKSRIEGYFHDILVHAPDCDAESEYIDSVLNKYKLLCRFKSKNLQTHKEEEEIVDSNSI